MFRSSGPAALNLSFAAIRRRTLASVFPCTGIVFEMRNLLDAHIDLFLCFSRAAVKKL